jgi:hypothetical protein
MAHDDVQMLERYVYAVTKRLPHNQREDIAQELRGLIGEMAESTGDIETVLRELGDPALLADTYRGEARYLIGPRYYDFYIMVLKIVGFAVTLGIAIALGIGFFFNTPQSVGQMFGRLLETLFGAYAGAFTWITIMFWGIERYRSSKGIDEPLESWRLDDLPEVPQRSAIIPRTEPIVSLVFLVIFFAVLNSTPWLLRILDWRDSVYIINPFIPEVFKKMLPLFNLTIVIAMGIEFAKLYTGVQSKRLAVLTIGLKLVSLAISLYIVAGSGIWNPSFVQDLAYMLQKEPNEIPFLGRFWEFFPSFLVIVMVLGYVVETIETVWRTWRLKLPKDAT